MIGDATAVPPLRTLASEDPSAWVRFTAIDSLATLGDADGMKMLAQLATDPAPLLSDAERYLQVKSIRHETPQDWRKTRKFAAKRLRQLQGA
jgi:HEAT repeat protein